MTSMASIQQILRNNYVNGTLYTHISMDPNGKYQMNNRDIDIFFKEYSKSILNNETLCIAEKPGSYLPILVDIDIKIAEFDIVGNDDIPDTIYSEEQVKDIINIYQSVLNEILNSYEKEDLYCVLLEKNKKKIEERGNIYIKRGFHLHFPGIFLSKDDIKKYLLPKVKEIVKEEDIFANLEIEDSSSLIDDATIRNAWLMYGSSKSKDLEPYILSKIYDNNCEEISLEEAFINYKIYDSKEELIKLNSHNIKENLPRILSIMSFNRPTKYLKSGLMIKKVTKKKRKTLENMSTNTVENLKEAKILLEFISPERAENYNDWMTIGWALYNIGEGSEEALNLWINFSENCSIKFDELVCINEWNKMIVKDMSLGTLIHYVKIDNPKKYEEYKNNKVNDKLEVTFNGCQSDIAKLLHDKYGDEYICANLQGNEWYKFNGQIWEINEEGVDLRLKLSNEVVEELEKHHKEYHQKFMMNQSDLNSKDKRDRIGKLIAKLKTNSYKRGVMSECKDLFYNPSFNKKLNNNEYLIAFKNGVYDLKLHKFRNGCYDDYLTKCMPIEYKNYTFDNEDIKEVESFLEKIFPDKELRQYFLDSISEAFIGGNKRKLVHFWTGDGDNGKSVTQSLIEGIFGCYSIKFNSAVLTGKSVGAGAANAELARAGGGVRWAVIDEPNNDELINCGPFKKFSGNDTQFVRDLYQSGKDATELKLQFKLVIICNDLPKFKDPDAATFNRTRVIPFESTFCRPNNPAPESYEEQLRQKKFPMDTNFSLKLPKLRPAFAWYALENLKNIKQNNNNSLPPEKVLKATAEYKKQCDIYKQFIEENVVEDESANIKVSEMFSHFKDWYKSAFPGKTVPDKDKFTGQISKRWGTPLNLRYWKGYRFRTHKDDAEDKDEEEYTGKVPF